MPNPRSNDKPPRLGMGLLLGLCLLALLVVLRSRVFLPAPLPVSGAGRAPADAPLSAPPARLAPPGMPVQEGFALLAVTRAQNHALLPPPGLSGDLASIIFSEDATGLWVRVAGGVGVRTMPGLPGRHRWPLGNAVLVTTMTERAPASPAFSAEWFGTDGRTPLDTRSAPYSASFYYSAASASGRPATPGQPILSEWRLTPRGNFTAQAQLLTADGRAMGGLVTLPCQPMTRDLLCLALPGGYSARAAGAVIRLARRDAPEKAAVWRITGLPRPQRQIADHPPVAAQTRIGALTVKAEAREARDVWNASGIFDVNTPRVVTGFPVGTPVGVPVLLCRVSARADRDPAGGRWEVQIKRVTPQWTPQTPVVPAEHRPSGVSATGGPSISVPSRGFSGGGGAGFTPSADWRLGGLTFAVAPSRPGQPEPPGNHMDIAFGAAYPGQQKFVQFKADAFRRIDSAETLTFRDGEARWDAAARRWRLVWAGPQTMQTRSGIRVCLLNARPGAASEKPAPGALSDAELWLAWRLPAGMATLDSGTADVQRFALPLRAFLPDKPRVPSAFPAPFASSGDALNWGDVWLPGAALPPTLPPPHPGLPPRRPRLRDSPLAPFFQGGYQIQRLPVALTGLPPGPAAPRRIAALALQVGVRREVERHPVRLLVPVRPLPVVPSALDIAPLR